MISRFAALAFAFSVVLTAPPPLRAHEPDSDHEELNLPADPVAALLSEPSRWDQPLGPAFLQAATDYDVPADLLVVLGWLGSNFENRGANPTIERGYGVMALRENALGGDSLALASQLTNTDLTTLKLDPVANIRGAAAVLDEYAHLDRIDRSSGIEAWVPAVIRYAGLDAESSGIFAMEVFQFLQSGLTITNTQGEVFSVPARRLSIDPDDLAPAFARKNSAEGPLGSPDYGPATWDPAASCNYSTTTSTKDTVIVHTVEGSYAGCISWFKNCSAQVSAHYVIAYDGRITQMVRENQRAWHASCYNTRAIGLEHEGYAAAASHPQAQYDASADLVRDICDAWGIPKEHRSTGPGILGHVDVTRCCCGTHTDPGNGWDWNYYISRINGGAPPAAWAATFSNQSFPATLKAGETAIVWAEFVNDGTGHWRHAETRLGTSSPQDRSSLFCTAGNWVGCNRPTDVDQSDVAQGQIGRFTFILTAPATPGTYVEKFKLVREGITWFGPEISWTITVLPPDIPQTNVVFSDGFNGNLNNWTQQVAGFAYSTGANHGSLPGAGAAYLAAAESDQMYHTFSRPFAQGKVSGWFWDPKGGFKTGTCGFAYRQSLSLREFGGSAAFILDNCLASNVDNQHYFWRKLGGGSPSSVYNSYATRNPATDCNAAWIYFETTVTPAAAGASPTGGVLFKVTDGAGTTTTTTDLTTDFSNYGIGRITLGLGVSSAGEGYWDDIAFEALPPAKAVIGLPVALSSTEIRWSFAAADAHQFGFDVADGTGAILSPQYPNAGWLNRNAAAWTQGGLSPNTIYARKARAWNGTLDGAFSEVASAHTLSAPPVAGSVTANRTTVCPGEEVIWTAVGGFGPGAVQYYKYVWSRNPAHSFDGTEPAWSAGTLALAADEPGPWYLHVQGFNGDNVANGTFSYALNPPAFARADFDQDQDVDMDDFGRLQRCLSGQSIPQADPACAAVRLDTGDLDVDQDDIAVFAGCLSGAGNPADPCCAGQ